MSQSQSLKLNWLVHPHLRPKPADYMGINERYEWGVEFQLAGALSGTPTQCQREAGFYNPLGYLITVLKDGYWMKNPISALPAEVQQTLGKLAKSWNSLFYCWENGRLILGTRGYSKESLDNGALLRSLRRSIDRFLKQPVIVEPEVPAEADDPFLRELLAARKGSERLDRCTDDTIIAIERLVQLADDISSIRSKAENHHIRSCSACAVTLLEMMRTNTVCRAHFATETLRSLFWPDWIEPAPE